MVIASFIYEILYGTVCLHKSLVFILICEKSRCCIDLFAFSMTEKVISIMRKRSGHLLFPIVFSDELMFSTEQILQMFRLNK